MTEVPRHEFVPREYKSAAYRHTPLSIGHGQTISQPVIVALMTELLQPAETDKVLEGGTGSGYQAAILSVLAREVSTIEIVPEPGEMARANLERLGYSNASTKIGDGYHGWAEHARVAATDCGTAVNPAQIERQIAGSFVYGLSALFYQECTLNGGRIEQQNFDTYDSMRIAQMPKVESIVMPSGGFWGGVGEPTICVAGPAVLNAFFNATGQRIGSFPLKNHNIQFA
jgi:isoquinoline 1-oxidoreductase subunit beta